MFGRIANQLTIQSDYYLDWSRIGELAASKAHRYSRDELLTRAGMVLFTGLSGYLASSFNNEAKTQCSNSTMVLIGTGLGFVVSHAVVIYPLVKKRLALSEKCQTLATSIRDKYLSSNSYQADNARKVSALIDQILLQSKSDEGHSRASQTWGYRHRLLINLEDILASPGFDTAFWSLTMDEMIARVNDNSSITTHTNSMNH